MEGRRAAASFRSETNTPKPTCSTLRDFSEGKCLFEKYVCTYDHLRRRASSLKRNPLTPTTLRSAIFEKGNVYLKNTLAHRISCGGEHQVYNGNP